MTTFLHDHFEHVLCGLVLLARVGDVVSTYLATPTLALEANIVVKRLGWRFALLTLLVCLLPYYSTALGVMALVPFLMVSASNMAKIWMARTMGELPFADLLLSMARRGKLSHALVGLLFSSLFVVLAGGVLCWLEPDPEEEWGFWFGMGLVLYGVVILVHGSVFYVRLFRKARLQEAAGSPPEDRDREGEASL